MTVKMILACDEGNSIGWHSGELPWKIQPDMKRFKDLTMGHDVLMGWNTFKSLRRADGLPNRKNVVLTRKTRAEVQEYTQSSNVTITHSLGDWVQAHQAYLGGFLPKPDLWIIGGAQIYDQAIKLKLVDEIYLTQVHTLSGGDVTLPFDLYSWKLFVIRQRSEGVSWEMVSSEAPPVPLDCPKITFVKFVKVQNG